jgi:hypothetical protein
MTDLLTTIKDAEQLVRQKHQPGQHPQSKHTPSSYSQAAGAVRGIDSLAKAKTKDQIARALGQVVGMEVGGRAGIGHYVKGDQRKKLSGALEQTGWTSIGSSLSRGAVLGDPDEQVYQRERRKVSLTVSGDGEALSTNFRVM